MTWVVTEIIAFCDCTAFKLWYTGEGPTDYCRCGHSRSEHLDGQRTCVGDVIIYNPEEKIEP